MLWLLAIPAILGLTLVIRGWRGRRIDDHPLCRRCGYDLHGIVEPAKCPECGRTLGTRRAVRVGHRRRRRVTLVLGALLLLTYAGIGGLVAWAAIKNVDLNTWKPVWLIVLEARGGTSKTAFAAQTEILNRQAANELTTEQCDAIINRALMEQSDLQKPWMRWQGEFITNSWADGSLDQPRFEQYVRAGLDAAIVLQVPERARSDRPIWVLITQRAMRATGSTGLPYFIRTIRKPVKIDGDVIAVPEKSMTFSFGGADGMSADGAFIQLEPGTHQVSVEVIADGYPAMGRPGSLPLTPIRSVSGISIRRDALIEVVAPGERVVQMIDDPSHDARIRDAVRIDRAFAYDLGSEGVRFDFKVNLIGPPVDVAFDVLVRVNDREWLAGTCANRGGRDMINVPMASHVLSEPEQNADFPVSATTVDVVLRSSEIVAEEAGNARAWKGEIVISNVPLTVKSMPVSRPESPP